MQSQAPPQPNTTSPQQQFCLRWNNYQTNLTNVFDQLLQSESFVDVTLACDGHSVKAHKMVLSACSPYFQSLFFENPCQHPIVIMRDIKWPELKAAVEFMYKGEINVCQEQIGPLLKVAESLKIRGLADVNGEQDVVGPTPSQQHQDLAQNNNNTKCVNSTIGAPNSLSRAWDDDCMSPSPLPHSVRPKKRRRNSHERSGSVSSPADSIMTDMNDRGTPADLSPIPPPPPTPVLHTGGTSGSSVPSVGPSTPVSGDMKGGGGGGGGGGIVVGNIPGGHITPVSISSGPSLPGGCSEQGAVALSAAAAAAMSAAMNLNNLGPPPPPPPSQLSHLSHSVDDLEIKPGIAEMIREEERAKLLESSHAWLGASTSSIADSYQYQLQSMWQKCWSTNQSLVHNLRFRERGPLKSWRPETMAEAIFSVLKEGLSLSQAARKYDIPYPTFVLYANRVHNMLGPSADGGADLRPKGRGRPQRILLGVWPDEHIRGVIRAVVFRDTPHHIKEEAHLAAAYPRIHDSISVQSYSTIPTSIPGAVPGSCGGANGPDPSVSPGMAAAVAAVAQGLRQQMCSMVAAAQHGAPPPHPHEVSGLAGLGFNPNHRGGIISPTSGGIISPGGIVRSFSPGAVRNFSPNGRNFSSYFSSPTGRNFSPGSGGNFSPSTSPQDLRGGNVGPVSPTQSHLDTPLSSPLALDLNTLAGSVEVGLSTGIAYKPPRIFAPSPRPENLFHDEIEELVKTSAGPLQLTSPRISALADATKDVPIKLEPMTECRSE